MEESLLKSVAEQPVLFQKRFVTFAC